MKFDSMAVSAIWGRVAGGTCMILSVILGYYGYDFAPEDQREVIELGSAAIGIIGGGLAIFSKIKETRRRKEQ